MTSKLLKRAPLLLAVVAVAAYVMLVLYASPDYRGSDQYWYVEDVETILGSGPATTHEVYPFSLVGEDRRFDEARPFIHNAPVLWVWAGFASVVGDAFRGILFGNVAFSLLSAAFVYLTLRRLVSDGWAVAGALALLYLPLSFWTTSQALSEPFSGLLLALALWLVVAWPKRALAWAGAAVAIAVAAVGRVWTLPLVLAVPVGAFAFAEGSRRSRMAIAALAGGAGVLAYAIVAGRFTNYMPGLASMSLFEVSKDGYRNMLMFYDLGPERAWDLGEVASAVGTNLRRSLAVQLAPGPGPFTITPSAPAADYWPANVLAIASLVGLAVWRRKTRLLRFVFAWAVLAFGTHVGITLVYQNMPRYMVPILPALAVGAFAAAGSFVARRSATGGRARFALAAAAALLVVSVVVDVANARLYRASALGSVSVRATVASVVDGAVPPDARVVQDMVFVRRWPVDAALAPRETLVLTPEFPYDDATYRALLDSFDAEYLVADAESVLPSITGATAVAEGDGFTVYRLDR